MKLLNLIKGFFVLLIISFFPVHGKNILVGPNIGYWGSPGGSFEVSLLDLNKKFPMGFIIGAGYFFQNNPGNAEEARRIFINDNTGGVIQKDGTILMTYFDITYPLYRSESFIFRLTAGPRYAKHTANFAFLGDNEVFDINSTPYGIGAGIRFDFELSKNFILKLGTGFDVYEKTQLGGHGKFYYDPDSIDDNPRQNYTYEDADKAIYQPDKFIKFVIGIDYRI
ncbi:MAG: hypothetical protein OEZ22_14195 [Spirochaetia bacterium]|nr:hypothetical protein [Spirochaetia bacterium]